MDSPTREKMPNDQKISLSEYVVAKFVKPFLNKGGNITCDNFFTSVTLAKSLKSKKTSIVAKLLLYSTRIFKNEELALTVYQGKPSKNVLVLSSVHDQLLFQIHSRNSLKMSHTAIRPNLELTILIRWLVCTIPRWHLDDSLCRFSTIY